MSLMVVNMPNEKPQIPPSAPSGGPQAETDRAETVQTTAGGKGVWQARLSDFAAWLGGYLRSPRTRLGVVGVIVLLVGVLWITNSVWTLPLIVVGIVMVIIAWVGSRLDGRFAVEWGAGGTQLEFRAQIKAPAPMAPKIRLSPPPPPAQAQPLRRPSRAELEDDVIEGEGHTVEIDVAELKTLIKAAEAKEAVKDDGPDRGEADSGSSERRPAA
jgi:hypothetical protein